MAIWLPVSYPPHTDNVPVIVRDGKDRVYPGVYYSLTDGMDEKPMTARRGFRDDRGRIFQGDRRPTHYILVEELLKLPVMPEADDFPATLPDLFGRGERG